MKDNSPWTDGRIAKLRDLWEAGMSMGKIGAAIGVTKNAVVGKVHRLGLPARPSPIQFGAHRAKRPAVRLKRHAETLPPMPRPVTPAPLPPLPAPPKPPAPAPLPRMMHPCSWPFGEPGKPGFRFCDAATANGKSYCAEHHKMAYTRVIAPPSATSPAVFVKKPRWGGITANAFRRDTD